MSAKLTVGVKNKGRGILAPLLDRPVRLMPDGLAGIVYGGDVYPVHEGDYIDLSDRSIPKDQCPKFLLAGRPVPYVPSPKAAKRGRAKSVLPKWNVETTQYGNYLVFDGERETAEQVVALMRASGLGVRRWDVSSRPAADGYEYDWFIRLEFEGSNAECERRVAEVLRRAPSQGGAPTTGRQPDGARIDPADLASIIEMTRERLQPAMEALQAQARAALSRAEVAEAALQDAVRDRDAADAASHAAAAEVKQERAAATRLQKRLEAAEKRAVAAESAAAGMRQTPIGTPTPEPGLVSELRATVTALQRERDDAMQGWIDADGAVSDLTRARDLASVEADNLRAQLTAVAEQLERVEADLAIARRDAIDGAGLGPSNGGRDKGPGITSFFRRAWPHLVLHPDCLEAMDQGFTRLTVVFALLADLNARKAVPASSWNNHKDVLEVDQHLSTGRDSLGRVYYRRLPDDRLWVLLHRKSDDKEQERTVKRFAALDLQRADSDF